MQCHVRARIWDMTVRGREHRAVIVDRGKDEEEEEEEEEDDDDEEEE